MNQIQDLVGFLAIFVVFLLFLWIVGGGNPFAALASLIVPLSQ